MKITHDAWKCEICGHKWLAFDSVPPEKCAKCKSRKWNNEGKRIIDTVSDINAIAKHINSPVRAIAAQIKPVEEVLQEEVPDTPHWTPDEYS
jgi:hypothetical protein